MFSLFASVSSRNLPSVSLSQASIPLNMRQRGQVVRAPDMKSGGHGLKSRSDHLAGVVSQWTLVQLLGHACI